jgi:hypothetical protein
MRPEDLVRHAAVLAANLTVVVGPRAFEFLTAYQAVVTNAVAVVRQTFFVGRLQNSFLTHNTLLYFVVYIPIIYNSPSNSIPK